MTARRTPAPKAPAALPEDAEDGPLRLSSRAAADPRFTERQPLFVLDSVEHSMPLAFPTSVLLSYIHLSTRVGIDAAIDFVFETALGAKSYAALRAHPTLTDEQYAWIRTQILNRLFGRETPGPKATRT